MKILTKEEQIKKELEQLKEVYNTVYEHTQKLWNKYNSKQAWGWPQFWSANQHKLLLNYKQWSRVEIALNLYHEELNDKLVKIKITCDICGSNDEHVYKNPNCDCYEKRNK